MTYYRELWTEVRKVGDATSKQVAKFYATYGTKKPLQGLELTTRQVIKRLFRYANEGMRITLEIDDRLK